MAYLFVLSIGGRDDLGEVLLVELQHILEELKVRLIAVRVGIRLGQIRNEGTTASGAEFSNGQWSADTKNVLQVQVGLTAIGRGVLIIETAVEGGNGEVLALSPGSKVVLKVLQVSVARVLLQIAGEGDLAARVCIGLVITNVVKLLQTGGGNDRITVRDVLCNDSGSKGGHVQLGGLAVGNGLLGANLAKTGGRLDGVDVRGDRLGDVVLQCSETADVLHIADVPFELGIQEFVRGIDGSTEVDPVGILGKVGHAAVFEPLSNGINGVISGKKHALHLVVGGEVLAVAGVVGIRHLQDGLFEPSSILLREGDLQTNLSVAFRGTRIVPS